METVNLKSPPKKQTEVKSASALLQRKPKAQSSGVESKILND